MKDYLADAYKTEVETESSSYEDSCSTQSSQTSSVTPAHFHFSPYHHLSAAEREPSIFAVEVQSVLLPPTGSTSPTSSSSIGLCVALNDAPTPTFTAVLPLDRHLYWECWESTPLAVYGSEISRVMHDIPSHISSRHAELHFHFRVESSKRRGRPVSDKIQASCTSVTVVDYVGNTFLQDVPLHPFHRYHCPLREGRAWCADDAGRHTVHVGVGRQAAFSISFGQYRKARRCRDSKPPRDSAPGICAKKCAAALKKRTLPPKVSQAPTQSPISSTLVVYTSGVRLTKGDLTRSQQNGFLLNPDFKRAKEARILVAAPDLQRSVKLLSVLPHIDTVVPPEWLKLALRGPCSAVSTLPPLTYTVAKRRGSIEDENNFSLAALLALPVEERETLFHGLIFWVHTAATPQEPPFNDLKTVITHSGGSITAWCSEADVLILPPSTSPATLLTVSVDERSRLMERCAIATPDQLFRSVLRQDVRELKSQFTH